MNFKALTENGKRVLINFDNVCEVFPSGNEGCHIFFNVSAQEEWTSCLVSESIGEIEALLNE
tara:strand:- start:28 stop:213 length:186 start_codon:yes stop_codon:yes gene_type:complete